MMLALADRRPAHLTEMHAALTTLPAGDQARLGVTEDWKAGPHQLTRRQAERTFGLVTAALARDKPDGTPPPAPGQQNELRVLDADPHADAIAWPVLSVTSITEPVDLGPFEDATAARVLFLRRHGLFGGVSGPGKSGGLNVLMGNLTACADVVIWAVDPSGAWNSARGPRASSG
jgi:hypothetical protein